MSDTVTINATDLDAALSDDTIDITSSVSSPYYTTIGAGMYTAGGLSTGSGYGNITISNGGSNWAAPSYTWASTSSPSGMLSGAGLHVTSDAEFEGDIKIKGRSLSEAIENIEKRLAILVPDPEKLEHFEALKRAYDNYKTLEALCELPKEENDS